MKALSIKQPWVHAILRQGKNIENRSWTTAYRGWLALHASGRPRRDAIFPPGIRAADLHEVDYSAICGVAQIVDVVTNSRSKWFWHPERRLNELWVGARQGDRSQIANLL